MYKLQFILFCKKKHVCSKPDLVCDADDLHICSRLLRVQLRQHSPLHLQHWLQSKQVGTFEENIILENICFVSLVWFTICSVRISRVIPREAISGPVPWSGSQLQHRLWLVCWRLNISDQTWRELTGFLLSFLLKYFFSLQLTKLLCQFKVWKFPYFPPRLKHVPFLGTISNSSNSPNTSGLISMFTEIKSNHFKIEE